MGHLTDHDPIEGSPELALIVFAFMAVFVHVLF